MASRRSLMVVASNTLLRQRRLITVVQSHTATCGALCRPLRPLLVAPGTYCLFSSDAAPASNKEEEQEQQDFLSPKVKELHDKMITLDQSEVELVAKLVMEKLGLSIPVPGQGGSTTDVVDDEDAEQQSQQEEKAKKIAFDVKLTGFDAKAKIKVIKEVRAAIDGLGLKEAKELVESAPKIITKDMKMEAAEELKKKLEDVGATVEIV